MPRKGKKGSSQKRPNGSGKSTKKQAQRATETRAEEKEETNADPAGTSPVSEAPADLSQPSEVIIQKCEQIKKLTASIQKRCKISAESKRTGSLENPSGNVQELEFLLKEIKRLAQRVGCDVEAPPEPVNESPEEPTEPIVFHDELVLPCKWPKTKNRVPYIFLHNPSDIQSHVQKIVSKRIKFYPPKEGSLYTKILCGTFEDHEKMVKYFEDREMPYHTFSHPSKKVLKVVIRGVPDNVDLTQVKELFDSVSIPVIRLHDLNTNADRKCKNKVILVIVPDDAKGRKLLQLKSIFGRAVQVERPLPKVKQCHRCQKWGHAQRYCQGRVRCVKCSGEHFSQDCTRDPEMEPPKCANCNGDHTASYRKCPHCPDSAEYKEKKLRRTIIDEQVTDENE